MVLRIDLDVKQRGNSQRIVHCQYLNGKRVFEKHTVKGTDGNRKV